MTLRVIGAGFGRTGTLSLKFALEKLGFEKCYHMMEVHAHPEHRPEWVKAHRAEPVDWDWLFEGYQASVDWPACNFWREQLAHFPEAKVILSVRDPDRWYESVMNTIYKSSIAGLTDEDPARRYSAEWVQRLIWDGVFRDRMDDREHVIAVYKRHNEMVRSEVPNDKLLVFEPAHGWEPLCQFLDIPVPEEPYPKVNTSEEFNARWKQIRDQGSG